MRPHCRDPSQQPRPLMFAKPVFSPVMICLLVTSIALFGCAGKASKPTANVLLPNHLPTVYLNTPSYDEHHWHAVRFRLPRDEKGRAVWAMDLLLAHQIVAPLLQQYQQDIPLWRFHRRAGRDSTGHQFSWIFYADAQTAQDLFAAVNGSPLLLQAQNNLREVLHQAQAYPNASLISATSDQRWAEPIQQNWPYYMTGVSQMWLGIIDQLSREQTLPTTASFDDLLAHYRLVEKSVNQLWREQGQHAFLHHLNASFGYEPLFFGNLIQF